jgi:outer membrane protein OmpA-like peptidoglycan-associated protein
MRTKQSPSFFVALGLLMGCGPIAFNDTINFENPKPRPDPVVAKADPAPEPKPTPPTRSRAKLEANRIVIDEMIQFEYDSAVILEVSHPILDDVVKVLVDNPRVEQLDIIGYTSSEGSKKHNDELSTNRAAAVKQYLIDKGIAADRLTSQGKGPADPIASNDTEEGRIANRRVEFHVTKMGDGGPPARGGARGKPGAR